MSHAYDVFLSYGKPDEAVARALASRLQDRGLRVWFDEWEIQAGDSEEVVQSKIEDGLDDSVTLVLCVSKHALASGWAALEGQTYRFRDPLSPDRRFILLRLDDAPLSEPLAEFLYVDWRNRGEQDIEKLVRACQAPGSEPPAGSRETSPARILSLGHTDGITSIAYHPDGSYVVSGSEDGTLRIWDLRTGACESVLEGHIHGVEAVAYHPDGSRVISGSADNTVRVWDLASGACELVLAGHTHSVMGVAYHPDGVHAISCSKDNTLRVWNLPKGVCERVLEGHTYGVNAVAYHPDGVHVLSGSGNGTLRVWDLASGKCELVLKGHTRSVLDVAYHPDGTHAISGSRDNTLRVWDLASGMCERVLEGHTHPVWGVAYDPDGTHAITGSGDRSVRVWDLTNGVCEHVLKSPGPRVRSVRGVAYHPDGIHAISGSGNGTLYIWDVPKAVCEHVLEAQGGDVSRVAYHPRGSHLAESSGDYAVRVWDLATGICTHTLRGHARWVNAVAYHPDGSHLVSASWDGTLRVWDLASGTCEHIFKGQAEGVTAIAYSPDGGRVVAGSTNGTLRVLDIDRGVYESVLGGQTDPLRAVAYSPDGGRIVSGSTNGTLRVWDIDRGVCERILEGHTDSVEAVAYHPDGSRVISGSRDCTVRVWDIDRGVCERILDRYAGRFLTGNADSGLVLHKREVMSVAYHPDGGTILSIAANGVLRVWSAQSAMHDPVAREAQVSYTNAKVVLVGESQAGKSGLAMRLAHDRWELTESTVGAWATQFQVPPAALPSGHDSGDDREIWLWDFGGQADQRLIHQLYLGDAALAVVVFDGQRDDAVLRLWDWNRALSTAAQGIPKILAAGRIDSNPVRISSTQLSEFCDAAGFVGHLETSAKNDIGCEELRNAIVASIDWTKIPWRTSPQIFQRLKDAIVQLKDSGRVLTSVKELRDWLPAQVGSFQYAELDAVIGLLAGPGAVLPLGFGDYVLLQPELLNAYAQCVIQSLRDDPYERGCIAEERVLSGDLSYAPDFTRLPEVEERIVLHAMHKQLVERLICLRDLDPLEKRPALLVFPSYFRRERPDRPGWPQPFMSYRFGGYLDEVYASLVVRLHHSEPFQSSELWRNAADLTTADGKVLGVRLVSKSDGTGELELHCDARIPVSEQVLFARCVQDHLESRATDVTALRTYICPECSTPVESRDAANRRLRDGKPDIACVYCECRIPLWDAIAQELSSPAVRAAVERMRDAAQVVLDNESRERLMVGEVYAIVARANQIARELTISDHGIDMEIEFKDDDGTATGKKVYLQLKSGDSHLRARKRDNRRAFTIKKSRHADYWADQAFPVLLVIRDSSGTIEWMEIRDHLREQRANGGWPVREISFDGQRFDVMSVRRLREQALNFQAA